MATLSLSLLGPFQASLGRDPLDDFRTRKVQALLIYLAAEPGAHSRDSLLNLLWPRMPEKSARVNLRQILYQLRQAIPEVSDEGSEERPFVTANRHDIQLNARATVAVDAWHFESLLEDVHDHDHLDLYLCAECARDLREVAGLYRGDFLQDFYLDDSNAFEEWAQSRREYFRRRVLDTLGILAKMAMRRRDYPAAETEARRQLQIDYLRESAHRQLMQALALSGRRQQALAAYERCRRALAEELSMAPAGRTTEIYEKIVDGDLHFDRFPTHGVRGYELKDEIGEGVYGTVYRAVQPAIRRQVAVKVIARKHADDADFIRRFEAEAQTVARLEHPYIVPLYDYWRDPQGAYLVMRYMTGGSLLGALEGGAWDGERAAAMVEQIAGALAVAHRQGIVHRDIKPANILLDEAGNAYLADFGIAKDLGSERLRTVAGTVVDTLDYVSPEQITGDEVSPHTDIYSLGAVLYETLTGEKPFGDASVARLLHSHLHEPIPLVTASRPDVPPEVDAVLQKATAKEPADRYDNVQAMAVAFRSAVRGAEPATDGRRAESVPALVEVYNPYKGLHAFQESDADDFFGREALVQQLVNRLGAGADDRGGRFLDSHGTRFMALVGPSGSGKSSAVKAGLIPALRDGALPSSDKWFITEMVPGTNPLEELELALWRVAVDPPPDLVAPMERDTRGILRTLRRILPAEPAPRDGGPQLLLIVDQFEELFTLVEDDARRAFFLDSLLQAMEAPRSPLRVVVTLRADFYDRPLQHPEWGQLLKEYGEIVLPLNRTELTWAVREPAARVGVRLEEGLAGAIVADVADQPGGLPLLQYAMTELFERREGNLITRAAYEELGGVQGALGRRAEGVYADLDDAGREAARQLFLRLVTLGEGVEDTRRRVLRSELEALAGADGEAPGREAPMVPVLDRFGAARFLTFDRDPLTRAPTVEVAHEALLREWPRLRRWLAESRDDVRLQRLLARAAKEWSAAGEDPSFLLRGARLEQFEGWAHTTELALTLDERDYLQASRDLRSTEERDEAERQAREARLKRRARTVLRVLVAVFALAAVVAGGLAIVANSQRQRAEASEQEALRQASIGLAAQAIAQLEGDAPERGVLLALAALEEYPYTPQAESALAQTVYNTHRYSVLRNVRNRVDAIEYSPDGTLIAGGEWNIILWDAISGEIVSVISTGITDVRATGVEWLSDNSGLLAAHNELDIVNVWDAATGEKVLRYEGHEGAVNSVEASADDRLALSASDDGTAHIWLIESGETVQIFEGHEGEVYDAIWSPDERQMATAGGDGIIRLWDVETGAERVHINAHLGGVTALSWSSDGARLASSGNDGLGRVWDAGTGELLFTLIGHDAAVRDIAWSPDNSRLATAGGDGLVRVWESRAGIEQFALAGADADVADVSWSPDGRRLAVSGGTGGIWEVTTPIVRLVGYSPGDSGTIQTNWPYWSADSSWVGAGSEQEHTYRLWDPITGDNFKTFEDVTLGFGAPDPDGKEIFLVNPSRLVNLETGGVRPVSVPEEIGDAFAIEWSPDGSLIAVQPAHPDYAVFDAGTLEVLFLGRQRECPFLVPGTFAPDNQYIAQTCLLGDITSVRITEALSGKVVKELEGHTDWTFFSSWSPDGSMLATTSADLTVRVWDVATGETATVFTGHTTVPVDLDWAPNGTRLVSGDMAGNVLVWDTETGGEVNRYNVGGSTFGTDWSPDGTRVLTTGYFDAPDIRPVWQSTKELIQYAYDCCVFRELTAEEREQFGLPAADDVRASSAP